MKKKDRFKLKISLFVLVAVAGISFLVYEELNGNPNAGIASFNDESNADMWSIGDIQELSFTHSHIVCSANHQLHYQLDGGQWLATSQSGDIQGNTFSPVTNSLAKFLGGAEITNFRLVTVMSCDFPSWIDSIDVSGKQKIQLSTRDTNGNLIPIGNIINENISEKNLLSKKAITTNIYQFSSDIVDDDLIKWSDGTTQLYSQIIHDYDFDINTASTVSDADDSKSFLTLVSGRFVKTDVIEPPSQPPSSSSFEPMELISIKKAVCSINSCTTGSELIGKTLDTSDVTTQLLVSGILQDYSVGEINPQIKILQPNGVTYQVLTLAFDTYVGDDGKFKGIAFLPVNAMNGDWTFQMTHDTRQTSTRTITIQNSEIIDNPITNPQASDVFKSKVAIGFTHVFTPIIDGVDQTAVIQTGKLDQTSLNIQSLDIINADDFSNNCEFKPFDTNIADLECGDTILAGSKQLKEIRLYPLVLPTTPEDAFTILNVQDSSGIKADVSLRIDGKTKEVGRYNVISDPVSSASAIQCGASDVDGNIDANKCLAFTRGISLGRALVPTDDIEIKIFSLGLDKDKVYPITLFATVAGNFEMKAKDGTIFGGVLPALNYEWNAKWHDPSFDGESSCNSSDPTKCCPADTIPVWSPEQNKLVCEDGTCDVLGDCPAPTTDSDNDGIPDDLDSCPFIFGSAERNGCPDSVTPKDTDGDGVPDAKDVCPDRFGTKENNGCPDDAPEVDTDGDGVPDAIDLCPSKIGTKENNGCPKITEIQCDDDEVITNDGTCKKKEDIGDVDLDTDGDGVLDKNDKCPDTPKNTQVDSEGCTIKQKEDKPEEGVTDDENPKGGAKDLCFDGSGNQIECPNDDMILYIVAGLSIAGGVTALALKRRK